jgi:hypothetical protein
VVLNEAPMTTHSAAETRLVGELHRLLSLHARAGSDADYNNRRIRLREWQSARLARTHADLLASPRFHAAAQFFLDDLYGPQDISAHVDIVRRALPLMLRTIPPGALDTVADALELAAMSEDLDAAMVEALLTWTGPIDAGAYGAAYRAVGRQDDRIRQIALIAALGRSLDRLTKLKFIGAALKLMRKPAELAGLGALQTFMERGYSAFRTMRGPSEFVEIIVARENEISRAVFDGDDSGLA